MGLFESIGGTVADNLIASGIANNEERELYVFGVVQTMNIALNVFTTILIGFLFGTVWESVVFLLSHIPLRSYAGGYHAKTPLSCYLTSLPIVFLGLLAIRYLPMQPLLLPLLGALSYIVIWLLAPTPSINKPLNAEEIKHYGRTARMIVTVELALVALFWVLGMHNFSYALTISFSTATAMVVCGRLF